MGGREGGLEACDECADKREAHPEPDKQVGRVSDARPEERAGLHLLGRGGARAEDGLGVGTSGVSDCVGELEVARRLGRARKFASRVWAMTLQWSWAPNPLRTVATLSQVSWRTTIWA